MGKCPPEQQTFFGRESTAFHHKFCKVICKLQFKKHTHKNRCQITLYLLHPPFSEYNLGTPGGLQGPFKGYIRSKQRSLDMSVMIHRVNTEAGKNLAVSDSPGADEICKCTMMPLFSLNLFCFGQYGYFSLKMLTYFFLNEFIDSFYMSSFNF